MEIGVGEVMEKRFYFDKIDYNKNGRKDHSVIVSIRIRKFTKGLVFSVIGIIMNSRKTHVRADQCLDTILSYVSEFTKENAELFKKIHKLWKRWHLNNLGHGSPEQIEIEKGIIGDESLFNKDANGVSNYDKVKEHLRNINMYKVNWLGEEKKYGEHFFYPIDEKDEIEILELFNK